MSILEDEEGYYELDSDSDTSDSEVLALLGPA